MLLVDAATARWIHVGDSRLYRFREGRRVARTLDHSVVELLRLQGRIDEEEMKRHPDRNRLFEALGGHGHPDAETGDASVSAGDGFLLASDGLWENVDDGELEAVLGARNLEEALTDLAALARERGGERCDNISVAVARYGRPGGPLAGKTAVR